MDPGRNFLENGTGAGTVRAQRTFVAVREESREEEKREGGRAIGARLRKWRHGYAIVREIRAGGARGCFAR